MKVGWAKPFKEKAPFLSLSDLYQFTQRCVHEYGEYVYKLISDLPFFIYIINNYDLKGSMFAKITKCFVTGSKKQKSDL
jgi:hypothetical protein